MVVEFSLGYFGGGLGDPARLVFSQETKLSIGQGTGFLQKPKSMDERGRHTVRGDIKVVERSFRLGTVIPVVGHLDLAHRVGFRPLLVRFGVFWCHLSFMNQTFVNNDEDFRFGREGSADPSG